MRFAEETSLDDLAGRFPHCRGSINSFTKIVKSVTWKKPTDVNGQPNGTFKGAADGVRCKSGRTVWVFDVARNDLRVIAAVDYDDGTVTILWTGTHKEYDKLKVKEDF